MPKNPLFVRFGSKRRWASELSQLVIESKAAVYIEPFVGGGAVYFNIPQSIPCIINDLDKSLIDDYKTVRDIVDYPPIDRTGTADERTAKTQRYYNDYCDTKNPLIAIVKRSCGFIGRPIRDSGIKRCYKPFPKTFSPEPYRVRLNVNTTILCGDGLALIREHCDDPQAFIFIDPPYEKSKGLYIHSECDYAEMAKLLAGARCKWFLTLNDSADIRKYFEALPVYKAFDVGSVGHGIPNRKDRTRTIWSRPLPPAFACCG